MNYYDRYKDEVVAKLPARMDLGRFAVEENGTFRDLTNVDVVKRGDYVIRESLFEETNQNIHDLLRTIATSFNRNMVDVVPIIQKFNTEIKEFEKLLDSHKSHLRAIVANPHSLLDKNTSKVNIGRAKRLSTRSYQYLAHHSEDWEKMSILSPKPRKILNEELIIDYAVYENLLLKSFLHEAIKELNARIKETADISKFFLSIFGTKWICNSCGGIVEGTTSPNMCPYCKEKTEWTEESTTIWSAKINRRNALVGKALKSDDKSKASGVTNSILTGLKRELVKLEHAHLFEEFPKHSTESVVFHDTNVLNTHKHYKYLKVLWFELKKLKEQGGDLDPIIAHQDIMSNFRIYVKSLFVYSLEKMGYKLESIKNTISASHDKLPQMDLESDKYGVLHIRTANSNIRIVVLGGVYNKKEMERLPYSTICFCFRDFQKNVEKGKGIYFVNPIDTDSIECSGSVIRGLILSEYSAIVGKKIDFKSRLTEFLSAIDNCEISFDKKKFTFSFSNKLPEVIDEDLVISNLKDLSAFKQYGRRYQDELLEDMKKLVSSINDFREEIKKTLVCPKCQEPYRLLDIKYLACDHCSFICDISNNELKFYHKQKKSTYINITKKGWGMDLIKF